MHRHLRSVITASIILVSGIASAQPQPEARKYPDVLNVKVQAHGDHRFDLLATNRFVRFCSN
jgi:hypothetical protein